MTDIQTSNSVPRKGRSSRHSLRIDMTPMVDLGFLLITFFVFTTSMVEQKSVVINFPSEEPQQKGKDLQAASIIHFVIGKNIQIFTYPENHLEAWRQITGRQDLFQTIYQHKLGVDNLIANRKLASLDSSIILIEPTKESVVQNITNVVDVLTELKVYQYTLNDVSAEALQKVK